MSKQAQELYALLRGLNDKGMGAFSLGEVKSVDNGNSSLVVVVDEMEIADVRLKATTNGDPGFKVFPVVGSLVLIQRMSDGHYMVAMYTEVEFVDLTAKSQVKLLGDGALVDLKQKVEISNQAFNLLDLMKEFIDICMNEIHMTNAGPTVSLNPANKIMFGELKDKFSALLK